MNVNQIASQQILLDAMQRSKGQLSKSTLGNHQQATTYHTSRRLTNHPNDSNSQGHLLTQTVSHPQSSVANFLESTGSNMGHEQPSAKLLASQANLKDKFTKRMSAFQNSTMPSMTPKRHTTPSRNIRVNQQIDNSFMNIQSSEGGSEFQQYFGPGKSAEGHYRPNKKNRFATSVQSGGITQVNPQQINQKNFLAKSVNASQQGIVEIKVGGTDLQYEMDSYKLLPKVKNSHRNNGYGLSMSQINLSPLRNSGLKKLNAVNSKIMDMQMNKIKRLEIETERVKNFNLKNKSGKEIVDYVSSFGRSYVDTFVKEVQARDLLLTKANQKVFPEGSGSKQSIGAPGSLSQSISKSGSFQKVQQLIYKKLENHRKQNRAYNRSLLHGSIPRLSQNEDIEVALDYNTGRSNHQQLHKPIINTRNNSIVASQNPNTTFQSQILANKGQIDLQKINGLGQKRRLSMMEMHRRKYQEFIPYDPDKKQNMNEKVQRYLDLMEDEDEEILMNNDKQLLKNIQIKEKEYNSRKRQQNLQKQQQMQPKSISYILQKQQDLSKFQKSPQLSNINKAYLGQKKNKGKEVDFLKDIEQKGYRFDGNQLNIDADMLSGQDKQLALANPRRSQHLSVAELFQYQQTKNFYRNKMQFDKADMEDKQHDNINFVDQKFIQPGISNPQISIELINQENQGINLNLRNQFRGSNDIFDDGVNQTQKIIQLRNQLGLCKKERFEQYIKKDDKFIELFTRLSIETQIKDQQRTSQTRKTDDDPSFGGAKGSQDDHSGQGSPKSQQENIVQQQFVNQRNFKLGPQKISRGIIRSHINRRYKKTITDKIMNYLEDHIKSVSMFDFNAYIDILFNSLIQPIPVKINREGQMVNAPGLFKFCFDIFDQGEKDFVCEHDLIQIMGNIQTEPEKIDQDDCRKLMEMHTDYVSIKTPITVPSVFIDSLGYDICYLLPEMQAKIPPRINLLSDEYKQQQQAARNYAKDPGLLLGKAGEQIAQGASTMGGPSLAASIQTTIAILPAEIRKGQENSIVKPQDKAKDKQIIDNFEQDFKQSKKKGKQQNTYNQMIWNDILKHILNNMKEVENAQNPDSEQDNLQKARFQTKIDLFHHNNNLIKDLENKKKEQKYIFGLTHDDDNAQYCKRIRLRQFIQIPFYDIIPQFMEDFFQHMTSLSLMEFFYLNVSSVDFSIKRSNKRLTQLNEIKSSMSNNLNLSQQPKQQTESQFTKSRKMWKHLSYNEFPYEDLQFLQREFQMDNIRIFWGCIEPTKTEFDEIKVFNSVVHAFRQLSQNGQAGPSQPNFLHDLDVYITLESLRHNLPRLCKVSKNDSFIMRFYHLISMNKMMKRVYLPQFLAIVHPIIYGNFIEKNHVAFRMYDGDNDGVITSLDLTDLMKNMLERCPQSGMSKYLTKDCFCPIFKEVKALNKFILQENIFAAKKTKKPLDFHSFLEIVNLSVLIIEIQQILFSQFKDEVEKELIEVEKIERRKRALLQAQQRRDSSIAYGQEQLMKSRKKGIDPHDLHLDLDIKCSDPIVDQHLPPKQFSIFDHSSQQNMQKTYRWVQKEQAEQAPESLADFKQFNEQIYELLRAKTPPKTCGSIKSKIEAKRWFILRTGQVPIYASCVHQGNHTIAHSGGNQENKEEKAVENLQQFANELETKWVKKFNEQMTVDEDLKAFFPQKFKEPLSAISSLTRLESLVEPSDFKTNGDLQIGSVLISNQF